MKRERVLIFCLLVGFLSGCSKKVQVDIENQLKSEATAYINEKTVWDINEGRLVVHVLPIQSLNDDHRFASLWPWKPNKSIKNRVLSLTSDTVDVKFNEGEAAIRLINEIKKVSFGSKNIKNKSYSLGDKKNKTIKNFLRKIAKSNNIDIFVYCFYKTDDSDLFKPLEEFEVNVFFLKENILLKSKVSFDFRLKNISTLEQKIKNDDHLFLSDKRVSEKIGRKSQELVSSLIRKYHFEKF